MAISKAKADSMLTHDEGILFRSAESRIDKAVPYQKSFSNEELRATSGSATLYINSKVKAALARAYRAQGWSVEYDDYTFRLS